MQMALAIAHKNLKIVPNSCFFTLNANNEERLCRSNDYSLLGQFLWSCKILGDSETVARFM